MAEVMSRSFLSADEIKKFAAVMKLPKAGDLKNGQSLRELVLFNSKFLEGQLLAKLRKIGPFEKLHPILLGSWARQELCPYSDLDILFLGPDDEVLQFVQAAQEQGLKLRYRVPQDRQDWTVGVKDFDILALMGAHALTTEGEVALM